MRNEHRVMSEYLRVLVDEHQRVLREQAALARLGRRRNRRRDPGRNPIA